MSRVIERFSDAAELHHAAALSILRYLNAAIVERDRATLVLSGGSTPKAVYELLGSERLQSQVDWTKVHLFWGDERCVPPTHPESNFRMTNESLLKHIVIPEGNIHRIHTELAPHQAAELYARELKQFFALYDRQLPRFDVVLLGLGEDGHTASLFPETDILDVNERLVADVFVSKLNASRVSITYPVLNTARVIMFLVSGRSKATIVRDVLSGEPHRYPAESVRPTEGVLYWLLDDAAAAMLTTNQSSIRNTQ